MMIATTHSSVTNLFFRCDVPGLIDKHVYVHLSEVEAIIEMPIVTPVPFSPSYVHGLAWWNHEVLTIIDLAAALLGNRVSAEHLLPDRKFLVARVPGRHASYLIGWPLLREANTISLPSKITQADLDPAINRDLVLESILIEDAPALILKSSALNSLV